ANSDLTPGVFLLDLDNGAYVDINGNRSFSAASTIKIPILMAFFQDVDAGKIRLDEMLTLEKEMIVGGSGNIQYQAPGSKYTAVDLATKMITISDNTATNML
ncbi:MAG: serine hydrolase, partial [Dolichospermum sp.]